MKRSTTKRALWLSVVSMFLCLTMFMGTTFAWFTDEVTSGTNTIVAGNLDVELYNALAADIDDANKVTATTKLFELAAPNLWEPGAVVYENFTIVNEGNLALKYKFSVNITNAIGSKNLADVLKVGVVADGIDVATREEALAKVTTWKPFATFMESGELYPDGYTAPAGATGTFEKSNTYGIVIWWEPSAIDNEYNMNNGKGAPLSIDIGIDLVATQLMAEGDSFGSDYDKPSEYPMLEKEGVVEAVQGQPVVIDVATAPSIHEKLTTVTVPAGAVNEGAKVGVTVNPNNTLFKVSATGEEVATIEVKLTVDGTETDGLLTGGSLYTVETYISKGLVKENVVVEFTGTAQANYVEPVVVDYNADTGYLKFTTNHFSEYAVKAVVLAYDKAADVAISEVTKLVEALKDPESNFVAPSIEVVEAALDKAVENDEIEADAAQGIIDNVQAIVKSYVARVGEVYYTDFAEALAAANNGTLVLLADLTLEADTTLEVAAEDTVTIDLNGKAIIGNIAKSVGHVIKNNGNLTLIGGTVKSVADNGGSAIYNAAGATLTINGTTIVGAPKTGDSWPSYAINNYGEMNVNNATVTSNHGAIAVYGDTVIEDTTVTLNGIGGSSHVFYVGGEGTDLVINGGTYTHGGNVDGSLAYIMTGTTVTVNDGEFYASNGGYGLATYTGELIVNGGYFANAFLDWGGPITIKGGSFAAKPNEKHIAEDYKLVTNGDGTYSVTLDLSIMSAMVGDKYFKTLEEAFAAANDGDTITLLSDKTLTETLVFDKDVDVTFDLGGHTISGQIGTLLKLTNGTMTLKNGAIKNVHEAATETKYSVYMTGDAVAKIENVDITTTGVGIYMDENAKITELNANVDSYMNANGYCCYDAISMVGNARIDKISGGKYESHYADSYIAAWDVDHKYSGIISYTVNLNDANVSIGEISGGTFLGVMDKANNGTPIHVNNGAVELISGGYFGFSQTGLTQPDTLLFVNTSNGGAINEITGGTFVKGDWKGFGCDFAAIVEASGCQVTETSETVDVYVHFSTRVATYTLAVVEVSAK